MIAQHFGATIAVTEEQLWQAWDAEAMLDVLIDRRLDELSEAMKEWAHEVAEAFKR